MKWYWFRASVATSSGVSDGIVAARGGAGEQHVDRVAHELDVAVLFRGDVRDEVVERLHRVAAAEVERLERVVHQRRHLAELAAQQFLHGGGRVGRGVTRCRQLDGQSVDAKDQCTCSFRGLESANGVTATSDARTSAIAWSRSSKAERQLIARATGSTGMRRTCVFPGIRNPDRHAWAQYPVQTRFIPRLSRDAEPAEAEHETMSARRTRDIGMCERHDWTPPRSDAQRARNRLGAGCVLATGRRSARPARRRLVCSDLGTLDAAPIVE